MKNWKQLASLAGVILVLGGLAYWDDWQTKKDADIDAKKNLLLSFDPSAITEFTVSARASAENSVRETVRIQKSGDQWNILEPVSTSADARMIETFLKSLAEYKYEKPVVASKDRLGDFGLDDAARKITLVMGAGESKETKTILVGSNAPVGYSVYSRVDGSEEVYIGSQYLDTASAKGLKDFRNKTIAHIDEAKLKSLTFQRKGFAPIHIVKNDTGYTVSDGQVSFAGDSVEISGFINGINDASAAEFDDAPLSPEIDAALESDDRPYSISWETDGGAPQVLAIGEKDSKFWAAREPQVVAYELPDGFEEKLRKQTYDFRNRKIFSFDSASLSKVEMDGSTFEAVNGEWYAGADVEAAKIKKEGDTVPQAAAHVRGILVNLEFAKTLEFAQATDSTLASVLQDAPKHKFRLIFADSKNADLIIEAWKRPGSENFLLRHSASPELYVISKDALEPPAEGEDTPGLLQPDDPSAVDAHQFGKEAG